MNLNIIGCIPCLVFCFLLYRNGWIELYIMFHLCSYLSYLIMLV